MGSKLRMAACFEPLEPRRMFDTTTVSVGDALGSRQLLYTDMDGTAVRLNVSRGFSEFTLEGTNLGTVSDARKTIVTGEGLRLRGINFVDSSDRTVLTGVASGGNGRFSADTLTVAGIIGAIRAPKMSLAESIDIGGLATQLYLNSLRGVTMNIGGAAAKPIVVNLGKVWDSTFTSQASIRLLSMETWYEKNPPAQVLISVPRIDVLRVREDLGADLTLTGGGYALGSAQIGGQVLSSQWTVTGSVRSIVADRFADDYVLAASQRVDRIVARETTGGNFGLGSLGAFSTGGDLVNARFSLFDSFDALKLNLGSLNARGNFNNLQLYSDGNLGTLSASRGMVNSTVFAGLDFSNPAVVAGALPTGDVFTSPATIRNLRLGGDPSFYNSFISAYHLGNISLGANVLVQTGGTEFGAYIRDVRAISGRTTEGVPFLARIPLLGDFFSQTRDKGRDTRNLIVVITPQILTEDS